MKIHYPKKIIECIDKYFPKGNRKRGEALVLQAVAYIEGKEQREKEILEMIDERFNWWKINHVFSIKQSNWLKDELKQKIKGEK